jgi:hypothetical protein
MKINKRDIKPFFLGMLTLLIIDAASDWKDCKAAFEKGYNYSKR